MSKCLQDQDLILAAMAQVERHKHKEWDGMRKGERCSDKIARRLNVGLCTPRGPVKSTLKK